MTVKVTIPLKTISEANRAEHWFIKAKRHKMQKNAVALALNHFKGTFTIPCHVHITRIAPRVLDKFENLPMSLKWIADSTCEIIRPNLKIGQADAKGIEITCDQRKGNPKEYAIEIEIKNL